MIKHNTIEELFAKLNGALAQNTIRAYRSDYAHFSHWCETHEIEPLDHSSEQMLAYINDTSSNTSVATITRRLNALSSIFKFLVLPDTTKSTDLYLLLKKLKRQKGSAQEQAEPLTKEHIEKMFRHCGKGLIKIRNKILLLLGNQTMRRRSELCAFKFEDIRVLPGKRYGLQLRFSKTDQVGKGKTLPISEELYTLLIKWQKIVGDGFILRGIIKNKFIRPSLCPASINLILRDIQHRSRIKTEKTFSGHSFRVGGALDMLMAGIPIEKIMLKGGWNSESTVIQYLRAWDMMEY